MLTTLLTGTSYVNEDADLTQTQPDHQQPWLKYDRTGPVPILLIPQPSDDPYDPLVCFLLTDRTGHPLTSNRTGHYGAATSS
jgi:hypothetical protein